MLMLHARMSAEWEERVKKTYSDLGVFTHYSKVVGPFANHVSLFCCVKYLQKFVPK